MAMRWSHDAKWDPKTRQVLFIGIGHYAALKQGDCLLHEGLSVRGKPVTVWAWIGAAIFTRFTNHRTLKD
ncbi:MAG: hypothetical protein ACUVWX_13570 [Kiritimatiellia bacterium]